LLASLTIRNFVLIEDAVLEFSSGLNVLTGETGAGKTLLTKALGLLMGERAEEGLVGDRAKDATIQAIFDLDQAEVDDIPDDLKELVGGVEPGEFIVARRLGREGRNRCFVNDTAVTLGAMGNAVARLLSFAGQHEYRRLLEPTYQLSVLDNWAGTDVIAMRSKYRVAFEAARQATKQAEEGKQGADARLREIEMLRFQTEELGEASLSIAEEKDLLAEQKLLASAEEVLNATRVASSVLKTDAEAIDASSLLAQAGSLLSSVADVDPALDALRSGLLDIQERTVESARDLQSYADGVSVDPGRLEMVNERLRLYTDLTRKYGGSTQAAVALLEESQERLRVLEATDEDLARLEELSAAETAKALEIAAHLSEGRHAAAPRLEQAVAAQLSDLGMADARVTVDLQDFSGWQGMRESGGNAVEFLLAANAGQRARSLAKTASGGELSRVLLAIKCALAGAGGTETLVFDEIDAGIGGRTAVAVGKKLRELAEHSQLLVITHLPQVAALSSRHFLVDKVSEQRGTVSRLFSLSEQQVIEEICRMLGGGADDTEAMAHARELRDRAAAGLLD